MPRWLSWPEMASAAAWPARAPRSATSVRIASECSTKLPKAMTTRRMVSGGRAKSRSCSIRPRPPTFGRGARTGAGAVMLVSAVVVRFQHRRDDTLGDGPHDRLRPARGVGLAEDLRQMPLHGPVADRQLYPDGLVGVTVSGQAQDFEFTFGERLQREWSFAGEAPHHLASDGRVQHRLALANGADRLDDVRGIGRREKVAIGAR